MHVCISLYLCLSLFLQLTPSLSLPLSLSLSLSLHAHTELDPHFHGFTDADLDRKLNLLGTSSGGHSGTCVCVGGRVYLFLPLSLLLSRTLTLTPPSLGFLDILSTRPDLTLREVLDNLKKTYCNTIGVEYMHIGNREKCNWIRDQVENPKFREYTKEKKLHIHERLAFADHFEKYLANKFNTAKRFGLEGGESCIAGLKAMIDRGSELGAESFCFGMPHRGRLNVRIFTSSLSLSLSPTLLHSPTPPFPYAHITTGTC